MATRLKKLNFYIKSCQQFNIMERLIVRMWRHIASVYSLYQLLHDYYLITNNEHSQCLYKINKQHLKQFQSDATDNLCKFNSDSD